MIMKQNEYKLKNLSQLMQRSTERIHRGKQNINKGEKLWH